MMPTNHVAMRAVLIGLVAATLVLLLWVTVASGVPGALLRHATSFWRKW